MFDYIVGGNDDLIVWEYRGGVNQSHQGLVISIQPHFLRFLVHTISCTNFLPVQWIPFNKIPESAAYAWKTCFQVSHV